MKKIKSLFEYQKFNPNVALQARIDSVTARYMSTSKGCALSDNELYMVSAAGETYLNELPAEEADEDKQQR